MIVRRGFIGLLAVSSAAYGISFVRPSLREQHAEMPSRGHAAKVHLRDRAAEARLRMQVVETRLRELDAADRQGIAQAEADIRRFFAEARARVPLFAEYALGIRSKWLCVCDFVSWNDRASHERYLKQLFREMLFDPAQLEATLKGAIERCVAGSIDRENRLLLELRADIDGAASGSVSDAQAIRVLRQRFESACGEVQRRAGREIAFDAANFIASEIATEVVRRVVVAVLNRAGASAAILGTGASASWASCGLTLAVGVLVDQFVCWWWDAEGQLARKLDEDLKTLEHSLLDGEGGLLPELQKLRKTRSQVRGEAFRLMISESVR